MTKTPHQPSQTLQVKQRKQKKETTKFREEKKPARVKLKTTRTHVSRTYPSLLSSMCETCNDMYVHTHIHVCMHLQLFAYMVSGLVLVVNFKTCLLFALRFREENFRDFPFNTLSISINKEIKQKCQNSSRQAFHWKWDLFNSQISPSRMVTGNQENFSNRHRKWRLWLQSTSKRASVAVTTFCWEGSIVWVPWNITVNSSCSTWKICHGHFKEFLIQVIKIIVNHHRDEENKQIWKRLLAERLWSKDTVRMLKCDCQYIRVTKIYTKYIRINKIDIINLKTNKPHHVTAEVLNFDPIASIFFFQTHNQKQSRKGPSIWGISRILK